MAKYEKETETKERKPKGNGRSKGKTDDSFKGKQKTPGSAIALSATQLITSANIGYGYPLGLTIEDLATQKGTTAGTTLGIPSILAYYIHPHIGRSQDASSKVNLAAHRLYTSFVYANGRSPSYDVPDAVLAPLAVGQVASFYHFAARVYRTMNTFLTDNRSVPRALAKVQCVDYDDFKNHLSDFAHWLENYRFKLMTLFLPGNLPIIEEWCGAYDDVYLDEGANPKAQMYLFVPEGFFKYNEKTSSTGGFLKYTKFANWNTQSGEYDCYTYAAFTQYGDDLIDILVNSQDINKIQADIMLSYGPQSVAVTNGVSLGESLEFKTDGLVSATLHNATLFCGLEQVANGPTINIIQQNNQVIYTPAWQGRKTRILPILGAKFFDSPTAEVNPLLNATMARMTALAPVQAGNINGSTPGYVFYVDEPDGCVVPSCLGVYTINDMVVAKSVAKSTPGAWALWYPYNTPGDTANDIIAWYNNMLSVFKLHPIIERYGVMSTANLKAATSPAAFELQSLYGDVNYYTVLPEATAKQILDTYIFAQLSAGLA
jgi:hypothetical protein